CLHFSSSKAFSTVLGLFLEYREVVKATALSDKFSLLILSMGYLDRWSSYSGSYLFGGTPLVLLGGSSYLF
ncbi:hypothetical protein ABTK38_21640, partial [Acinetobacter baumannii]